MKKAKKLAALLLTLAMAAGLAACEDLTVGPSSAAETHGAGDGYIPSPYTADSAEELTAEFLEPVFYENEGGPTVGVTLLGVVAQDGLFFRDLDNDRELDDFEDWRLDGDTRAAAFAASLSDGWLARIAAAPVPYGPNAAVSADAVDETGAPVWNRVFSGGSGAEIVARWNEAGWRSFVMSGDPETEVAVWFNNGLEQYAEYDAIQTGAAAVPFLSLTTPGSPAMPGPEGIAAAVLGDGSADLVLAGAQYDRVLLWNKGIDGVCAQVDLVTDPRWSLNSGSYGEREDAVAEIARALVIGYQNGGRGVGPGGVLVAVGRAPDDAAGSRLVPFTAAFEAGASELSAEAAANGGLTREELERAAVSRIKPRIQSGDLDNPYRDLEESVRAVNGVIPMVGALAEEVNLKSVVLMKNSGGVLPLASGARVYVAGYDQKGSADAGGLADALRSEGFTVVDDYNGADVAYLYVSPAIQGADGGLAVLELARDVETPIVDNDARPTGGTAVVTTVADMEGFRQIADAVHANGGKVVGQIDVDNAWILTNMEPCCDALIGVAGTGDDAVAQVVAGKYGPTGRLPITMPADAGVIALGDAPEACASPNDVPGYAKDQYMDQAVLKASPSGSYAYKDSNGSFYISGFGLSY